MLPLVLPFNISFCVIVGKKGLVPVLIVETDMVVATAEVVHLKVRSVPAVPSTDDKSIVDSLQKLGYETNV